MVRARVQCVALLLSRSRRGDRGDVGGAQDRGGVSADRPGAAGGADRVHGRPMPRRSPRSPPRGWPTRLDGCDLPVIDVDDPASTPNPAPRCRRRPPMTSPTSSTPRAPPVSPRGWPSPTTTSTQLLESLDAGLAGAGAGVDAVSLVCLRLLGVGDLGCAAAWWAAGGGARVGGRLTGGLPRLAGQRTGQRAHPDPVGGGGALAARVWSRRRCWSAVRPARPRWWIGGRPGG